MDILGFTLPLWSIFLILIVVAVIAWKLIKFAIKILLVLIVFFAILMGFDYLGVFDWIQGLFYAMI